MRKRTKQFLSFLLCIVLLLGMVPTTVSATESDGTQTTLDVSKGNIVIGDGTLDAYGADGTHLTTADPDGYYITGTTTSNTVSVTGGNHNISINGLNISASNAAFYITNAHVNLSLVNDNTLDSGNGYKDLHLDGANASLTINGYGTLYAGFIGGNNGGTITIEGGGFNFDDVTVGSTGTVTIKGGTYLYGNAENNTVGLYNDPVADHYKVVYYADRGWKYDVVFAGYSISFDPNGGTGEMAAATEISGSYAPPACTFTAPEGKVFLGWSLSADSTEVITGTINVVDDMTLYAVWGERNAAGLEIDATNFPDTAFRTYISDSIDTNKNGYLSTVEINAATVIDVAGKNISSLKGIEYFTALTSLDCDENQLTTLDVSKNTKLTILTCSYNQLTALDFSQNTVLKRLYCHNNKLTTLDVSNHAELYEVYCYNNGLQVLNVTGCPILKILHCQDNELTSLDITGTAINSTSSSIEFKYEGNGYEITPDTNNQFDLSTLPGNFNLAKVSNVTGGTISGNILTVDANTYLVVYTYDCGNGQTVSFRLTMEMPELSDVAINAANFPDSVFRAYVTTNFDTDKNGTLTVAELNAVTKIDVGNWNNETKIADLKGVEYFRNLTELHCDNNNLSSLDVSQLTSLTKLDCHANPLAKLDISKNPGLTYLYVGGSSTNISDMSSLDLSKNIALETVYVEYTKLTELDLGYNTKVIDFGCQHSQVTSLDLSMCTLGGRYYAAGNTYGIYVGPDGTFDLTNLPGKFDASKASEWTGGTVSGNILTVDKNASAVTYTYDCGKSKTATFTLNVTWGTAPVTKYQVTVTNGTGGGEYAAGETVTVTANAAPEGQKFTGWQVVSGGVTLADATQSTTTFTMPANAVEIKAVYKTVPTIAFASGYNPSKTYDGASISNPTAEQLTITGAVYSDVVFTWTAKEGSSLTDGKPVNAGEYTLTATIPATNDREEAGATRTYSIGKVSLYTGNTIPDIYWGQSVAPDSNVEQRLELPDYLAYGNYVVTMVGHGNDYVQGNTHDHFCKIAIEGRNLIWSGSDTMVIGDNYSFTVELDSINYDWTGEVEMDVITHTHNYTYSANGAVITESCSCGHNETATVKVPTGELDYFGEEYQSWITYSIGWAGNRDYELSYLKDGDIPEYLDGAGTYTVSLTIEGETATASYTIKKAPNVIKNVEDVSKIYDGTAVKNPDFSRMTFSLGVVSYDYKPYGADDSEYTNQAPQNAGKYTCRVTMAEDQNYKEAVATADFEIYMATPTVDTDPTASRVIIGGKLSDSTLTGGVASVDGTFTWKDGTEVLDSKGTVQKTVVFTPDDTANYNPVEFDVDVTVVICDTTSGEHEYTEQKTNADEHWTVCAKCCVEETGSREAHKGGTATCTAKAKCEVCDTEYGEAIGHGETEIRNAKTASCDEEGYTGDKHCKVCGEKLEDGMTIAKTAHTYENGKCAVCDAADPDYVPTSPQTGDNSNMALWIALLFISGMGIVATAVNGKRRKALK